MIVISENGTRSSARNKAPAFVNYVKLKPHCMKNDCTFREVNLPLLYLLKLCYAKNKKMLDSEGLEHLLKNTWCEWSMLVGYSRKNKTTRGT